MFKKSAGFFLWTVALALSAAHFGLSVSALSQADETSLKQVERSVALHQVDEKDFASLSDIVSRNPDNAYAHFLLGRCYERAGMLETAHEHHANAEKLIRSPEELVQRLRHHIESGEILEAYNITPMVARHNKNDPNVDLMEILFLQENGLLDQAELRYESLLKRPDAPLAAATGLAAIKLVRGQSEQAIRLADLDLRKDQTYVGALLAKAQALAQLGKTNEAISCLNLALKERPFNKTANYLMSRYLIKMGNFDAALAPALTNLACSDFLSVLQEAKDLVKLVLKVLGPEKSTAIVAAQDQMIDRTQYAMKYHYYLSEVYDELGQGKAAMSQIEKAIALDPEYDFNNYMLGRLKEKYFYDWDGAMKSYHTTRKLKRSNYLNQLALLRLNSRMYNQKRDLAHRLKEAWGKKLQRQAQ